MVQFAQIQLPLDMEPPQIEAYQSKKGQLQQAIEERRQQIEQLKVQRKAIPKHIEIKDLPDKDRFQRLRSEKKHFIDTIKLIAYRAETALAQRACAQPAGTRSLFNQKNRFLFSQRGPLHQ